MKKGAKTFLILVFILSFSFISSARLPIIGGDTDDWGNILNEFLNVSIGPSGVLRNINNTVEGVTNIEGNVSADKVIANQICNSTDCFNFGEFNLSSGGNFDGNFSNYSNQSFYWNNLSSYNETQMQNSEGVLNILSDWLYGFFYGKENVYNKTEVYNKSEVYNVSEVYNKTEVDALAFGNSTINWTAQNVTRVIVYKNNTQAVAGSTATVLNWNLEEYDLLEEFNGTRFTAKQSGYYFVSSSILFESNTWSTANEAYLELFKNGENFHNFDLEEIEEGVATYWVKVGGAGLVYLDEGDYIEIIVYHTRANSIGIHSSRNYNSLTISRLDGGITINNGTSSGSGTGSGIIESGSNVNGSYIKFADGTMIQRGTKVNTPTTTTIAFPVPFYDTSYQVNAMAYDTGANFYVLNYLDSKTTSKVTGRWQVAPQASNWIDWVAIGRWTNLTNISVNGTTWAVNSTTGNIVLFNSTANVGLGREPQYKLDVNGSVRATTYYGDGSQLTGINTSSSGEYINSIVESGNNSNGSYIKFIDGTMIAWGTRSIGTVAVTTAYGQLFRSSGSYSLTYPVNFIEPTYAVLSSANSSIISWPAISDTGLSYANRSQEFYIVKGTSGNVEGVSIMWHAIGKWTDTPYDNSTITVGGGIPSGAIVPFNRTSCPVGWALADGSSGTPDLRGIFIRGSGTNSILKYANGSYFSSVLGSYKNDSFQGHYHNVDTLETAGAGATNIPTNAGTGTNRYVIGRASTITADGISGIPRYGNETTPAYYSTIYCVKMTEDTATSNTIWATSGNNVLLSNSSQSLNLVNTSTTYYSPNASEYSVGTLHFIPRQGSGYMYINTAPSTSTWYGVSFASYVPSGAKAVLVLVYQPQTAGTGIFTAPSNSYSAFSGSDIVSYANGVNGNRATIFLNSTSGAYFGVDDADSDIYIGYPLGYYI